MSLRALVCLSAVTAAGCTAEPIAEGRNRLNTSSTVDFTLPVTSMIGRRFETVIRQQYDFSCGSAALATLLRYHYGDPQNEQNVFLGMWRQGDRAQIQRVGFSLLDMKRYLADRGISADGYRVSLDQIARAGVPGIGLVDFDGYKHFVVIKGVEPGSVLLGDPSLGLRRESTTRFQKQWNGVFFVLNGTVRPGQAPGFNLAVDRERAPRFRMFGEADPLTLAALALSRPQLNEF